MRYVILGAGRPSFGEKHTSLRSVGRKARVLDWSINAVKHLKPQSYFVCGYQQERIKKSYPDLNYIDNEDWKNTRAGWSLLCSIKDYSKETIVSYSDIVFHKKAIQDLCNTDGDIVVAIDSKWKSRYVGRSTEDMRRCEKVCYSESSVNLLGPDIKILDANAEFIGLVRFSDRAIKELRKMNNSLVSKNANIDFKKMNLSHVIDLLRLRGFKISAIDVHGDWAELNEPADLAKFILGTKAQTLFRLKDVVAQSRIEELVSFKVKNWSQEPFLYIKEIHEKIGKRSLIVRSSALSEDGFLNSSAGMYSSILNVKGANIDELKGAIQEVINSYPDDDPNNEVLVQPMLQNVKASGVAFTRSLQNGAPYYTINYDDISGSTESITSGTSVEDKTLIIRRDINDKNKKIPRNLKNLIPALREIEELLNFDSLDIEFALTESDQIHILQVRPIAVKHPQNFADDQFYDLLNEAEMIYKEKQTCSPFILGEKALFGVMPDWNPAEIIGTKPTILANSLYQNLILDEIWAKQRAEYGYRDVRPQSLLVNFSGHPYIDIRASFNSFVPANLTDKLAEKLISFCLNWLQNHPELHDKVEFEVMPTCFDLDFSRWETRLTRYGNFSNKEINQIRESLLKITNDAFHRNSHDLETIQILEERFKVIKECNLSHLKKAMLLLDDSILYGTLPFAHLARSAFIAVSMLRSAVSIGVLSEEERDDFLNTIHTVSHNLTNDSYLCANGKMKWEDFVEKYGHLRPGTYDITSSSYKNNSELYLRPIVARTLNIKNDEDKNIGSMWKNAREKFAKSATKAGLSVNIDEIEKFMVEAIEGREYAKFAFTRNLSMALDEITKWGEAYSLDVETLSRLNIEDFRLLSKNGVFSDDINSWVKNRAKENTKFDEAIMGIELPPLISNKDDFSIFMYPDTHANYIGNKSITAICIFIENDKNYDLKLKNKIVLIPQADPGYDWLFGRDIAGLITMYGGANSHMAIRAAEFGLPAAIGIGEIHYRSLKGSQEIELNSKERIIRIIN